MRGFFSVARGVQLLSSEVGNPDFSIIFRTWNDLYGSELSI